MHFFRRHLIPCMVIVWNCAPAIWATSRIMTCSLFHSFLHAVLVSPIHVLSFIPIHFNFVSKVSSIVVVVSIFWRSVKIDCWRLSSYHGHYIYRFPKSLMRDVYAPFCLFGTALPPFFLLTYLDYHRCYILLINSSQKVKETLLRLSLRNTGVNACISF